MPLVQGSFQISPWGISKGKMELQVENRDTGNKQRWTRNSKCPLLKMWPCSRNCRKPKRGTFVCMHPCGELYGEASHLWLQIWSPSPPYTMSAIKSDTGLSLTAGLSLSCQQSESAELADAELGKVPHSWPCRGSKGSVEQAFGLEERPVAQLPC